MPNHLHLILFFSLPHFSLTTIVSNAKRFMAYKMTKRLKQQQHTTLPEHLQSAVTHKERKKGQLHKVEESFDAKAIDNEAFFLLKLNYFHLNPVRSKYRLVADWREYEWSNAGFYELQKTGHFVPVHDKELQ